MRDIIVSSKIFFFSELAFAISYEASRVEIAKLEISSLILSSNIDLSFLYNKSTYLQRQRFLSILKNKSKK